MFNNNDSHDLGGTSNDHSGGHDRGTQRNESNTDIGGGRDARKRPGGRLTNREPSSSIYAPRLSIDSIGFKNYLRNFLKIKANIIKSEILKEAASRYQFKYGGNRHGGRRRHHRSPRPSDPINYAEEFQYEKLYAEQVDDECGENKCKPKDDESLGFKNYFKMFRCRFPDMDRCKALKKAKCIYENLSERTKQKYRDLGCDFKCCARRKAQPQCPPPNKCKPKRKPRKKCPPKPCPPKPCPPKPCPMDSSSSSMSVTESESDESSSSCDLKAQKRCSKPKQNPCCAPPKRAAPPKKPFCP